MTSFRSSSLLGLLGALALPSLALASDPFATEVSAGDDHGCMVTSCGGIECWGRNDYGQSADRGAPNPILLFSPPPYESVTVGQFHTCALDADGEIECWGRSNYGQASPPSGTFTQIDAGANHTCALDTDGHVQCWGADDQGQVSDAPSGTFVQVSAGRLHSCAVSETTAWEWGEVVCWGSDDYGQSHDYVPIDTFSLNFPGLGETIVEVVAGGYHTCARSDRWQTYCWGMDTYGAVGDALGMIPSINDPSLMSWGSIAPRDLAAGTWGSCMVRQPDGNPNNDEELICWGWPFDTIYPAPGDVPQQVSVGRNHACFIDDDDQVQCWGSGTYGKTTVPELEVCPGTPEVIDPFPLPLPWPWP